MVEPVEPVELFEWFAGVREAIGMEVVPRQDEHCSRAGVGKHLFRIGRREIEAGFAACMLRTHSLGGTDASQRNLPHSLQLRQENQAGKIAGPNHADPD